MQTYNAQQLSLFETEILLTRVVNVASVPQRSPFRYPGGKTWLIPYVRRWFANTLLKPTRFIEPFAGGGIVGLTVGFENLAGKVTLVELDAQVGAVWQTILENDAVWLADQIVNFDMTSPNVEAVLAREVGSKKEEAFRTIVRNRINRGGILAVGAGKVKVGENGKGLKSRWYPETLKKRILDINHHRNRFEFIQGDGLQVLEQNLHQSDIFFYVDPPYSMAGKKAGSRLYNHYELDHRKLFELVAQAKGDFLMSYDDSPEVRDLIHKHKLATRNIPMKNTHHAKVDELLIGRNLEWLS